MIKSIVDAVWENLMIYRGNYGLIMDKLHEKTEQGSEVYRIVYNELLLRLEQEFGVRL
jgi:hypothetical protein